MDSHSVEPQLGAESFSCPHCHAVARQDWYSLFLKQENATDVVVTLEALMLAKGNESDQFLQRLKDNVWPAPVEIQQAMDVLQVIRRSPLQPTQVDLKEENETATRMFESLREILKRRMLKNHNQN
jgi:hypothetical protein